MSKPLSAAFRTALAAVNPSNPTEQQLQALLDAALADTESKDFGWDAQGAVAIALDNNERWHIAHLLSSLGRSTAPGAKEAVHRLSRVMLGADVPAQADAITYFSQYDLRWRNTPYAYNAGSTVGVDGCWFTSMAMSAGEGVTPADINAAYGTGLSAILKHGAVENLGDRLGLDLKRVNGTQGTQVAQGAQAEALLREVREAARDGKVVMLGLMLDKHQTGWMRHSTLVVGLTADDDLMLFDSVFGPVSYGEYLALTSEPGFPNPAVLGFDQADAMVPPSSGWTAHPTTPGAGGGLGVQVPPVDLRKGASGPDVEQLQNCLIALAAATSDASLRGELAPLVQYGATGNYGDATQAAVVAVQRRNGVTFPSGAPADGSTFGPKTREALTKMLKDAGVPVR